MFHQVAEKNVGVLFFIKILPLAEILWNFTPRMPSQMPKQENNRVLNEQRGRRAENIAAMFLRLKGYTILDRRCRTPFGEIDIIARRGKTIVFVEVKARRDH